MRLSQSIEMPRPSAPGRRRARPWRARGADVSVEAEAAHPAVETPASSSILAIEPFSWSKRSVLTFSQPPRSSMVLNARVRELVLVLGQHVRVDRAVAPVGEALLGRRR